MKKIGEPKIIDPLYFVIEPVIKHPLKGLVFGLVAAGVVTGGLALFAGVPALTAISAAVFSGLGVGAPGGVMLGAATGILGSVYRAVGGPLEQVKINNAALKMKQKKSTSGGDASIKESGVTNDTSSVLKGSVSHPENIYLSLVKEKIAKNKGLFRDMIDMDDVDKPVTKTEVKKKPLDTTVLDDVEKALQRRNSRKSAENIDSAHQDGLSEGSSKEQKHSARRAIMGLNKKEPIKDAENATSETGITPVLSASLASRRRDLSSARALPALKTFKDEDGVMRVEGSQQNGIPALAVVGGDGKRPSEFPAPKVMKPG